MADTQTTEFNLIKPEIGGSLDNWGVKLNANMEIIDGALADAVNIDGTNAFVAVQAFANAGFTIGQYTISSVGGTLQIEHSSNGLLLTLDSTGNLTAKEVIADPSLA